jgi:hypothetical protein
MARTPRSPLAHDTVRAEALRPVLNALVRVRPFARFGSAFAERPDLTSLFPGADGVLEGGYTVDNGAKPPEATFHLA